ncbi:hypothetical protein [Polyangium aurulentum]|uniref:hypothetical protein n=1 Tax=Polyangium aurulentum TaxID=2567896 RepID=UPI0010ADD1DF|nr:hypothetical protein [Polyangium aurulentum]UQA59473.1 hypothetical protein E8A73_002890 [Polyangium aurulentum]
MPEQPLQENCLYNRFSNENARTLIRATMASRQQLEDHQCPWVQIGHVYVSLTVIGKTSWLPLIRRLHRRGAKHFVVYTGRHGNIVNRVDMKGKAYGIADQRHYTEDLERKEVAEKEMDGIVVDVVDTSGWVVDHTKTLRAATEQQLKRSANVIYAWCYGIFTYSEGQYDNLYVKYERLKPEVQFSPEGVPLKPSKWLGGARNVHFAAQMKAYDDLMTLKAQIDARDENESVARSEKTIRYLTGKYFLWA